ncbi:MAG: cytochrome c [Flavobacteriales bacterium]|jgi:cytochrome c551/c552|nr:cytochrome c [Flavobacteriales bacterium]MBT5353537.1 cytochrome c [Flavobacteriales bacterium]MBT5698854.1 cytochrome c [Flavobacteriales bacterium]MBT7620137.1 cytochrome c [Flavobacteriales bacterium]MBT7726992.1 cytochrome c [Flavobacteriales bacterium]
MKNINKILALGFLATFFLSSCGGDGGDKTTSEEVKVVETKEIDPMQDKGIGPITSVDISGKIDDALASEGSILFETKCTACHKMDKRKIGPAMTGVTKRRTPEWIMNMIMNPDEMVKENQLAKQLLMEYMSPMANQSLTESETRAILEFFRQNDI